MLCCFEALCVTNEINNMLLTDLPNGWPALQIRLLNELIYAARHLGDPSLTVRYDPSCVAAIAGVTWMKNETTLHVPK